MELELQPVTLREACAFVAQHHSHHQPHPRNVAAIGQLRRAWDCIEFARIVAKSRRKS